MRSAVIGAIVLASLAAVPAAEPTKSDLLAAVEKQLQAAHQSAGPCVACVVVSKSDRYPVPNAPADRPGKLGGFNLKEFLKTNPAEELLARQLDLSDPRSIADNGYACGVVIDPAGIVLTPYHVVEGATRVYVHVPGRAGSYADIHAADARYDLATLKLIDPPANMQAIKFAGVRLRASAGEKPTVFPGKLAVLVAHPYASGFAVDKPSAALGSVTNVVEPSPDGKDRGRTLDSYYYFGPLLQHDAKINLGIDGSALLNLDGEMIGLSTASASLSGERGSHFAIPADGNFRRVVEVLRRGEEVEYGGLGVSLPREPTILEIGDVTGNGPADRAGIQSRDIITHMNGVAVRNYNELLHGIGSALAGSEVKLTVMRVGRARDVTVTLGKLKHDQPYIASVKPEPVFGVRVDYATMLPATGRQPAIPTGVWVRELIENSPAAAAFKKLGDRPEQWVVTQVDGKPVATPAEFYKAAKGRKSVTLTVKDLANIDGRGQEVKLP